MALNYIWIAFFLIGFLVAVFRGFFQGDTSVFNNLVSAIFDNAKLGFEISLWLTGVLAFWLGMLKIGEKAGVVSFLGKLLKPFLKRIFPQVPEDSPAFGSIVMNIAANMLGLDNAATPIGLKAMEQLQQINDNKQVASNAQILFLVLNTSGLTIIPINIIVYRMQLGAQNPTDVFIPILIATFFSTVIGFLAVAIIQKLQLFNKVVMAYLVGAVFFIGLVVYLFSKMPVEKLNTVSLLLANTILVSIIILFLVAGILKKINLYETFIEGAKDGFKTAVMIIPYLIAILVAIGFFRASGALDLIINFVKNTFTLLKVNTDFVDALPTALMKPLSGSGARGFMIETMKHFGADSFAGRLACIFQGATDTTFYIIAVYFGAVGIKNSRYAIAVGLLSDFAGILAAILLGYMFFH